MGEDVRDTASEPGARTRVLVLFGGRSSEHSISCVTARGVVESIDADRFEVILVGITPEGKPVPAERDAVLAYSLDQQPLPQVVDTTEEILFPISSRDRRLRMIRNNKVESLGPIDIVFPLLHGVYGEDGTLQGMLQLADIPYVGCGVLASALCMDKHTVKTVLAQAGIPVAPWEIVHVRDLERLRTNPECVKELTEALGYPIFVKPSRAGSSVGVSRVTEAEQLLPAICEAFREDHLVLLESAVKGREVEVAVLQRANGSVDTSVVAGEIVFEGRDFYDFEAKYLGAGGVRVDLPAKVSDAELETLRSFAARVFEVCGCASLARVDMFLTEAGPVVNEVNTMPGFTPISMFPQLWEASGLSYRELITELITTALTLKR